MAPAPCEHAAGLPPVVPSGARCPGCERAGQAWTELWLCLSCGWVACADDSPGRHAHAHYEETDHPVAAAIRPGPQWQWCHVHRRQV